MAEAVTFRSADVPRLDGTFEGERPAERAILFLHGITGSRRETGLFGPLARQLARRVTPSLRFDFRAHGHSDGRQEDLTLSGCINDARAGLDQLSSRFGAIKCDLIASSFGGGIAAALAALEDRVERLVLIAPRLDYRLWAINDCYWDGHGLNWQASKALQQMGYLNRGDFRFGLSMLNEVLVFDGIGQLQRGAKPTLILHGVEDSVVDIQLSRRLATAMDHVRLIEVERGTHGLTDIDASMPGSFASRRMRRRCFADVLAFLTQKGSEAAPRSPFIHS